MLEIFTSTATMCPTDAVDDAGWMLTTGTPSAKAQPEKTINNTAAARIIL
jgi:hypothetical protein